jgi:polyhydroxyalkanoate synthesis repressor PhaR
MTKRVILIKKYENRRLYDTTNSRYINLDEVAQLLQGGDDVKVVDATSGEDITRLILTQIIVEDAKTPNSSFPLDILRQMVIATGRASQESALNYMKTMLDIYQSTYRAMPPGLNPFEFMQNYGSTQERAVEDASKETPHPDKGSRSRNAKKSEPEDVSNLQQRVAELEKLVSSLSHNKPPRKK